MRRHRLLVCAATLALSLLAAQTFAGTLVQFRTPLGTLDVELFDEAKPITVRNFLRYVQSGVYTNMFLHRWAPEFVVQGGGFVVAARGNTNVFEAVPNFGSISNEYNAGRTLSNSFATLAMARLGGVTNSATSQWFFNLGNNSFLDSVDGGFTVFGRVLRGTNVLNRFNNTTLTNRIFVLPLGDPFNELPVLSVTPTFRDLVYVDISLLNIQTASLPNGQREISWTSISNRPNHVEFTTAFPPSWQPLLSTNGTGALMRALDTNRTGTSRFYRVRVDY
jgi:cyclophilin family peptidyl-prolyl cis-trans isomerase